MVSGTATGMPVGPSPGSAWMNFLRSFGLCAYAQVQLGRTATIAPPTMLQRRNSLLLMAYPSLA